jgi:hypothetical protein
MEQVSRTVLAFATLATSSLFATAAAVGVAHAAQPRDQASALCRVCMEYRVAKPALPGHPAQVIRAAVPIGPRAI